MAPLDDVFELTKARTAHTVEVAGHVHVVVKMGARQAHQAAISEKVAVVERLLQAWR